MTTIGVSRPFLRCGIALLFVYMAATGLSADNRWISTDSTILKVKDGALIIAPKLKFSWIFLDEEISYPYEFSFTENLEPGDPQLVLLWNYYLQDASFKNYFSTGYNQRMEIQPDGRATLHEDVFTQTQIGTASSGPKRWRVVCGVEDISIFRDGELLLSIEPDDSRRIIPSVSFEVNDSVDSGGQISITNFEFKHAGQTQAAKPKIVQYDVPGRTDGGKLTVFRHDALPDGTDKFLDDLPALLSSVEREAGIGISHTDVVMAFYEEDAGAGSNLGAFEYYSGWLVLPKQAIGQYEPAAHEMAHYYACIGGICGSSNVGNNWKIEGLANYLGARALNRFRDNPPWLFHPALARKNENVEIGGAYDPPLDLGVSIGSRYVPAGEHADDVARHAAYGKGYMFFYLVSELYGHVTIQQIIKKNRARLNPYEQYSTEAFVDDLANISGADVDKVLNGWLFEGEYGTYTPADFGDADADGLLDFQEDMIGTNAAEIDTDGDFQTDFEELRFGTNPADASSIILDKEWLIDGLPLDFPTRGAVTFNGNSARNKAGKLDRLMLLQDGDKIIGAAIDELGKLESKNQFSLTVSIQDSAGHTLRVRWIDHELFSYEWMAGYAGPEINADDFSAAYTRHGCEFAYPADVFSPGKAKVDVVRWIVIDEPEATFAEAPIKGEITIR